MATILLVQDDRVDADLTLEHLLDEGLRNPMVLLSDGQEAALYLTREGAYANAVLPDLIMLDLALPRRDGYDLLRVRQGDQTLARIPVVVFGSPELEGQMLHRAGLSVDGFAPRQPRLRDLLSIVSDLADLRIAFGVDRAPTEARAESDSPRW